MPMRSVWFYLNADVDTVANVLQRAGATRVEDAVGRVWWNYPTEDACIYLSCSAFDGASEDAEELAEFRAETKNARFTVGVHCDVSGRVPGDDEVRTLARALLRQWEGYAFDDFTWPHAWSLDAIEQDARHDGLRFFDYDGAFERMSAQRRG
jgi:hypothetical protein